MTGEFDNDERYMEIPDLPDNFLKER